MRSVYNYIAPFTETSNMESILTVYEINNSNTVSLIPQGSERRNYQPFQFELPSAKVSRLTP
jgi:hypothetical protein